MISGVEKILLAVLVLVLMTGMGATLTVDRFRAILRAPKGVLIGLASQFGWMPLVAFGLAHGLGLSPEMAIGLIIVGCTPGGTTSNLFTYYARADLALSISMTAVSTIVAVAAMPLLLWLYARSFTSAALQIPYGSIASTLGVVLVPVAIGMVIRRRSARAAAIVERIGSLSGLGVLVLLVGSGLVRNGHLLLRTSAAAYGASIGLGLVGMGLGYLSARLLGLAPAARRAVALETGIQNSPLAFAIIIASFTAPTQQAAILWLPLAYALFVLLSSTGVTALFRLTAPRPPR